MRFVPESPINNTAALFDTMAWCRPGDNPFSELTMTPALERQKFKFWNFFKTFTRDTPSEAG